MKNSDKELDSRDEVNIYEFPHYYRKSGGITKGG